MAVKFCLLWLASVVLAAQAACPTFWVEFESNCYMYVGNPSSNWVEAEAYCVGEGSHLTSIHSKAEEEFVQAIWRRSRDSFTLFPKALKDALPPVSRAPFVYIGLNDRAENGNFVWTDGSPVDYLNWMRNNPSTATNFGPIEDGVMMWDRKRQKGKWNDVRSTSTLLKGPFVCKKAL